jgi:hypothetical protein
MQMVLPVKNSQLRRKKSLRGSLKGCNVTARHRCKGSLLQTAPWTACRGAHANKTGSPPEKTRYFPCAIWTRIIWRTREPRHQSKRRDRSGPQWREAADMAAWCIREKPCICLRKPADGMLQGLKQLFTAKKTLQCLFHSAVKSLRHCCAMSTLGQQHLFADA